MSMRSPAPSLGKVEFLVLLWTTFAAFAALYGPQPLLPVIQQHFGGSHNHTLLRFLPSTLSLPTIMSPHTDSHHKETRMDRKREASPASWTPLDKKEVFHPNTN